MGRTRSLANIAGLNVDTRLTANSQAIAQINDTLGVHWSDINAISQSLNMLSPAVAGAYKKIDVFTSEPEMSSSLPFVAGYTYQFRKIFQKMVHIGDPSDIVLAFAQFEITNDTGGNVGIGTYMHRSTNPALVDLGSAPIVEPARATVINVDRDRHHEALRLFGVDTGLATGDYYYTVGAYGMSTSASGSLTVEGNYGRLILVRFQK